jgi:ArsR family transcriptional regulator, arsenate/arsenite/antimonite-responsive transcriptional repressor
MDPVDLAKIAKALADPTRLRIYEAISQCDEVFCGELVEKYQLSPGTVSHHLKVLADAGLIESRREGQFIYNRSCPGLVRKFGRALNKLVCPASRGRRS